MYIPRFLVTQEVYDAASLSERQKYNYEVNEKILSLPEGFNMPVKDNLIVFGAANENIVRE